MELTEFKVSQKSEEMRKKYGSLALTQAEQVLLLTPFYSKERIFWEKVVSRLI